ncbi:MULTISPECIES: hypothetical protein [Vibrio]|nr:hypothetical protein [Vibrio tasmaniensis]TKG27998.1 hypothetical protein FC057_22690 [Vibrio tasmaniensis]TKG41637.1 hypothetical protein FC063_07180 [Vibrio tasmaniensis]TKG44881.1 hypothetical protein FC061_20315 [Vibrio tasmaniensis]TKG45027.1 hypothetical protein FC060_15735 [Vibrio tasmaniensis]TKG46286.1 hypothetical protein FC070_22645 [Vibrio tasmaniensis]
MNVAKVYLEMTNAQGLSKTVAITKVCDAVGLKYNSGYATAWSKEAGGRPIPPAVVKKMQELVAFYVAQDLGLLITEEQALLFASKLAPNT